MKIFLFLILSSVLLLLYSCKKKDDNNVNVTKEFNLSGKAQKGSFSPGANVTISELDTNLNPTGKSFYTTIMDYDGNFQVPNVQLVSNYVQLKVEGSYFDEYSGHTISNPITLYCILDISQSSHDNVNILTHLEKDLLIKYKQAGAIFSDAKRHAQRDVLSIFNLENVIVSNSEELDISNGVLLATTMIVTGSMSGSNLTTTLTNIRNDLNNDGVLNSTNLQTQLISQARFIYEPDVSNHLRDFYNSNNNTTYVIPQFKNYIDTFLVNSSYLSNAKYSFPIQSALGINLLSFTNDTTILDTLMNYSMSIQTDINSNINMEFQLSKMSGNGSWTYNNIQVWNPNMSYPDWYTFYHQVNATADMSLNFTGQGIAQIHVSVSNDYNMDISYDKYLKWGF